MAREWKPGDVGVNDTHGYRSIFVDSCSIVEHGRLGGSCWHNESGLSDPPASPRRPLAVIDPEDKLAVDRLVCLLADHGWNPTEAHGLRDALREFANPVPPKPDEPMGLGAVVEDADGNPWVKTLPGRADDQVEWIAGFPYSPQLVSYASISAVRVLSEGVTP